MGAHLKLNLAAVLIMLAAGICCAQDAETAAAERDFQRFDGNQSGWLSGKELIACQCLSYDKSGDNEVTKAEFFAGRGVTLQANKATEGDRPSATSVAHGRERQFKPGELVETGGGMRVKILQCRGAGEKEECEIQYYRGEALESIPRWESTLFLRNAEERILNEKRRTPDTPPTENRERNQPLAAPPADVKVAELNDETAAACSFVIPAGDASNTALASEQLFKRKIYDRYNKFADGTIQAPLKVGITFLSFQVSAPFKNIVRVDPVVGAYRVNDAAPVNTMIYAVKTEHIVCEQFRDRTTRKRVANKYACFKNRDGEWVCGADGIPKTTQLN